jgi:hypothetical protein
VWSATSTGLASATTWAYRASARAPSSASFAPVPDMYSPAPTVIWMMPSALASWNPRSAAFSVSEEVTLTAAYA